MEETKQYTLRNVQAQDLFPLSRIMYKIGAIEILNVLDLKSTSNKSLETNNDSLDTMIKILNLILANLPKIEEDVYTFLASLSDMKPKNIKTLDFDVLVDMIADVIEMPGFKKGFLKVASRFFK